MNCALFFHLQQEAYIANIKSEYAEQARKENEAIKHALDCPFCNGTIPGALAENLFGGLVIVTAARPGATEAGPAPSGQKGTR